MYLYRWMASSGLTCKYTSCLQRWKCQISAVFLRHISQQVLISLATVDTLPLCSTKRNKECLHHPAHLTWNQRPPCVRLGHLRCLWGSFTWSEGEQVVPAGTASPKMRCWRPAGTRCPGTPPLPGRSGSDPQTPLSFSVLGCPAASGMLTGVVLEVWGLKTCPVCSQMCYAAHFFNGLK